MKIEGLKIKENITFHDKVSAIEAIADSCFDTEDDGSNKYTPYHIEIAKIISIFTYFVDGVIFDEDDSIYDIVLEDDILRDVAMRFYPSETDEKFNKANQETIEMFDWVMRCVHEKVQYRKQEELAKINNLTNMVLTQKLIEILEKENEHLSVEMEKSKAEMRAAEESAKQLSYQNEVFKHFEPGEYAELTRMSAENFDPEHLAKAIGDRYFDSDTGALNKELQKANATIRQQTNEIETLQQKYVQEVQKDSAKNVMNFFNKKDK